MRDFFSPHLPDEKELEEFAEWAFGKYFRELDQSLNFMETWNYLHKDKLELVPTGSPSEDAPKMIQVWKDSKLA